MTAKSTELSRLFCHALLVIAGVFGFLVLEAEAQPGGRGRGGRPSWGEPGSILPEMRKEEFLEELKFTDDQKKQLEELRGEFDFRGMMRLGEDERKLKMKDYETKVLNLLTADQKTFWDKRKAELLAKAAPAGTPGVAPPAMSTPPVAGSAPPAGVVPKRKIRPEEPIPEGATQVASFDSAHDASDGSPRLSFNFQYAPWPLVLEYFAAKADLTLDLDDTPPGTFTYRDSHSYTPTQALDVINGYLLPRGYLLVRRDRFLVCLSIADGIPPNLAPQISPDELSERGKNELVSVVIPVRGLQAEQIVVEVRELLGPQGKASALKNTNSIVVTDIGSHVRRVYALISSESAVDTRDNAFKAIPLKHISATEAERMVRRLFGLSTIAGASATQAPGQPQPGQNGWGGGFGGWGGRRRGDRDGRGEREEGDQPQQNQPPQNQPAPPMQTASGNSSPFANKVQVAADVRTNHLLVTASAALLLVVEDAVKTLDTDVDANGNPLRRVDVPLAFKIYTVPGGEIATIAQTIDRMVPGVVLGQDPRLGKIHTQATPDEHKEIAALIEELGGEGSSSVAVIHLQKMDPVQLSNTLVNLYSKEGVRAPTVEADPLGRRLIVRGTPDQILQVKTILVQLGEGDGAAREKTDRGNVRSLTLGGRDPEELLPLLQDAWSASRPNPIRIKIPSRPKPIRDRAVPGADRSRDRGSDPLGGKPAPRTEFIRKAALESTTAETETEADAPAVEPAEESDEAPDAKKSEQPKADSDPISMQVVGDQLILSSSDPAALDRLEELYERVTAAIPARTKWNVFYLRSADATEAAQMVERLFPQSNVAASTSSSNSGMFGSLAGGFNSIGRGLMSASGLNQTLSASQNLRIVTDIRSNALYVAGPNDQVAEVEQILEVLDSSELPGSLRDRIPRTITVEHADVEEVAAVVESVFKDQMTPDNPMMGGGRGGPGGFNPLMMLMGGGGAAPGGRRQPSVQLSVGVDKRTNHLIVSCNDQLFQQIEELVRGIDERAEKSRQTVRVVKLDQADPTLVQQTLGSLMTKVTVGTTRRSRRPTTSSSGSTTAGSSSTSDSRENFGGGDGQREAFMQRMMMERMNNGGAGGFGGRRGFGGGGDGQRGGGFGGDGQRGGDRRRD